MNAGRKSELAAHLEKEKRFFGSGPSGSEKSGAKVRKGPPVKYPQPYTRDPNALFLQVTQTGLHQPLPPPMNDNTKGHSGHQPVRYKNVQLKELVGSHDKDTTFEVAEVDYYRGMVSLYTTEIDFLNREPTFSGIFRVESKKRYNNQFYVREILDFLQRGHSLLEPKCRCVHKIDTGRAAELGISMPRERPGQPEDRSSIRDGKCQLSNARCARNSLELSYEIAVGDIYDVVDKTDERLIDVLKRNHKIVFEENTDTDLWAFKAEGATCKQELLQLVKAHPLGYKEPSDKDAYNGVRADVDAIIAAKEVYMLENMETKSRILFPRRREYQLEVDDDIKQLWRDVCKEGGVERKIKLETLEQDLRAVGLAPTKQEKPEVKVTGKRKGTGKRQRTSKKPNHLDMYKLPSGGGR